MTPIDDHARDRIEALDALFDADVRLFHRLKALAERVHGDGLHSAARRGILRELDRLGPRTVPEMAHARPVSRQHVRMLVESLVRSGWVERIDNPSHRRSKRLRLTRSGRRVLAELRAREVRVLASLDHETAIGDLRAATRVLESVADAVDRRIRPEATPPGGPPPPSSRRTEP